METQTTHLILTIVSQDFFSLFLIKIKYKTKILSINSFLPLVQKSGDITVTGKIIICCPSNNCDDTDERGGEINSNCPEQEIVAGRGDHLQTGTIAVHSPANTNEEKPVEREGDEEIEGVNKI